MVKNSVSTQVLQRWKGQEMCKDTEEQTGKYMIVIFTQLLHCWDTNYHHWNVIWDQQQPLGVRRDEGAERSDLLGWCKWQSSAPLGELGVLH